MINIVKIFNKDYNIYLYIISFIIFLYLIYKKEVKTVGILLIKIALILLIITIIANIIIKLFINKYLYIFIKPIINNIIINILISNIIINITGCFLIITKKIRNN